MLTPITATCIRRHRVHVRALALGICAGGFVSLILSKSAFAQAVREAPAETSRGPARPTAASPARSEDILKLSPYAVQETTDDSYGALNSNSITEFNTALNKLPISADIFSQSFMDDVGVAPWPPPGVVSGPDGTVRGEVRTEKHRVTLSDLKPNTEYKFRIKSSNGRKATDEVIWHEIVAWKTGPGADSSATPNGPANAGRR